MKYFLVFFIFFVSTHFAAAQLVTLSGKITDGDGKALPFGTIYVLGSSIATSANENGDYALKLNKGDYSLVFRFIGYRALTRQVALESNTRLDLSLQQELIALPPISVGDSDPANRIMRNAISKRKEHLNEITSFSADVYIKGVQKLVEAPKKFLGENVAKVLDLDSNGRGILYLSESQSKMYFRKPDHFREIMTASKISGKNESLSFNKATDLDVNFYHNLLQLDELSLRGFISPLADYAFRYYRFKLLGTISENGQLIHKIEVIPRRRHDPVFSGTVYILDDSWRLQAADLLLDKNAHINFVDKMEINQQFIPVSDTLWMPSSLQLTFKGKVLGFSFEGYFLSVYSNYNLTANFANELFNGEILKITTDARKNDESYWSANRPVPLTREELTDYKVKDAEEDIRTTRRYKDSVDDQNNRLTLSKAALTGYTQVSTVHTTTFTFAPLLPPVFYNTVEGFGYQYQASFKKEYNLKNAIYLNTRLRYGLANHHFNPLIEGRYYYDPVNLGYLSMRFGSEVLEATNQRSSVSLSNSLNTLIYERNSQNFYEKRMLNMSGSYEVGSGVFVSTGLEYSRRISLLNTSDYRLIDHKNREFSSNNPFDPDHNTLLFPAHNAMTFNAEIDYAPAARYVTRPEGKFYEPFKYPRLLLTYRKGFKNFLGSDADFDFASFEVYQNNLNLGLAGKLSYTLKTGKFLNRNQVFFPDFYHYLGNNSLIFEASLRNFHYLDLYRYSTDRQFLEGHIEQNMGGFIMNKLPLLRKLRLDEIIGGAYLDQPANKNYSEIFFGLQRLIFRVDYALAFDGGAKVYQGFKFSYRIK